MSSQFGNTYSNYPDQSWVWGQGQNAGTKIDPAGARLLSPNEFDQLDQSVQRTYGGYMGYLNAYARQQKTNQNEADTYSAVQNGTYQPPAMGGLSGGDTYSSAGRKIPSPGVTTGTRIPSTTLHRGMSGNVTQQIAGGGVNRGLGGNVIPQTADQLAGMNAIDVAQTDATRNWNYRVPIAAGKTNVLAAALSDAQIKAEDNAFKGNMTAAQRYKESIRGQAQQRIDARATEDVAKADRWIKTMNHQEYMANVNSTLNMIRMKFASDLQGAAREDQQAWQASMAVLKGEVPNTEQSLQRQKEAIAQASAIADHNFENAKTKIELDAAQKVLENVNSYKVWLDKQVINPSIFQNTQALNSQRQLNGMPVQAQQPQSPDSFPDEASARAAGRVAGDIIMVNGKKFRLN